MNFLENSQQIDQIINDKMHDTEGSTSNNSDVTTTLGLSKHNNANYRPSMAVSLSSSVAALPVPMEDEGFMFMQQYSKQAQTSSSLVPSAGGAFFPVGAGFSSLSSNNASMADDLNRLVSYQQQFYNNNAQGSHHNNQFSNLLMQVPQVQPMALNSPPNLLPAAATAFSDRLWDWNPIPEANREYSNMSFK